MLVILPLSILVVISIVHAAINPNGTYCSNPNQSPISIKDSEAKYVAEKYFRILFVNYNLLPKISSWSVNTTDQSIQLGSPSIDLGSITIVKDYAMYQFNLQRINVRVPPDHSISGINPSVELQLIHSFAVNNTVGGRKVLLKSNYLVVSIFFVVNDTTSQSTTSLFDFTNLSGWLSNPNSNFLRDIKIKFLLNHMPAYIYEGSLTSGNCDPAIWLLQSNYNFIKKSDYDNLVAALGKISPGMTGNNRPKQGDSSSYQVYKNFNSTYNFTPSLINYNSSTRASLTNLYLMLTFVLFSLLMF